MNNEPVTIDVTRTREDYFIFSKHAMKELKNVNLYAVISQVVVIIVIINLFEIATRHKWIPQALMQSKYAYLAVCVAVMVVICMLIRRCFMPMIRKAYFNENQAFLSTKRITIDEKGFREASAVSEGHTLWQGVDRIERTPTMMLVYVDKIIAYVIPIRSFSTPEQANQFYENMLAYWHKANGRAVPVRAE